MGGTSNIDNTQVLYDKIKQSDNFNVPDYNTFKQRYGTDEGLRQLHQKLSQSEDFNVPPVDEFVSKYSSQKKSQSENASTQPVQPFSESGELPNLLNGGRNDAPDKSWQKKVADLSNKQVEQEKQAVTPTNEIASPTKPVKTYSWGNPRNTENKSTQGTAPIEETQQLRKIKDEALAEKQKVNANPDFVPLSQAVNESGQKLHEISSDPIVQQISQRISALKYATENDESPETIQRINDDINSLTQKSKMESPNAWSAISSVPGAETAAIHGEFGGQGNYADVMNDLVKQQQDYNQKYQALKTITAPADEARKRVQQAVGFEPNEDGVLTQDGFLNGIGTGISNIMSNTGNGILHLTGNENQAVKNSNEKAENDYLFPTQTTGWGKVGETIGSVAPYIIPSLLFPEAAPELMAGSEEALSAANLTSGLAKLPQTAKLLQAGMGASMGGLNSWGQTFDQVYQQSLAQGMPEDQAREKARHDARVSAGTNAAVFAAMPYNDNISKILTGTELKGASKLLTDAGINLSEFGTAGVVEDLANGNDVQKGLAERMKQLGPFVGIMTLLHAAPSMLGKGLEKAQYIVESSMARRLPDVEAQVKWMVDNKQMTPQEGEAFLQPIREHAEIAATMPDNLPVNKGVEIYPLMKEKIQALIKKKTLDPVFHPEIDEKIQGIDEKIGEVLGRKVETPEEETTVDKNIRIAKAMVDISEKNPDIHPATALKGDDYDHYLEHKDTIDNIRETINNIKSQDEPAKPEPKTEQTKIAETKVEDGKPDTGTTDKGATSKDTPATREGGGQKQAGTGDSREKVGLKAHNVIDYTEIENNNYKPNEQLKYNQGDNFEPVRIVANPDTIHALSVGAKLDKAQKGKMAYSDIAKEDITKAQATAKKLGYTDATGKGSISKLRDAVRDIAKQERGNIEKIVEIEPLDSRKSKEQPKAPDKKELKGKDRIADATQKLLSKFGGIKEFNADEEEELTHLLGQIAKGFVEEGLKTAKEIYEAIKTHLGDKWDDKFAPYAQKAAEELEANRRTTGVSNASMGKTETELGVQAPPSGEGSYPEIAIARGRKLLDKDPNAWEKVNSDFNKDKKIGAEEMSIGRAYQEKLAKEVYKATDDYGKDSPQAKTARDNLYNMQMDFQKMKTEWAKAGHEMQDETDIDTGTVTGLRIEYRKNTGKDFTPEQEKKAEELAKENQRLTKENDQLNKQLQQAHEQAVKADEAKKPKGTKDAEIAKKKEKSKQDFAEGLHELATALGTTKNFSAEQSASVTKALAKMGKALIDGGEATIEDVIEKLRPLVEKLFSGKEKIDDFEDEIKGAISKSQFEDRAQASKDLAKRLASQAIPIDGNVPKFTPADAKAIYEYSRREYLDRGSNNVDMIKGVASDLGLTPDQVRAAIAQPMGAKIISDKMYALQNRRTQARNAAKKWVRDAGTPAIIKVIREIPNVDFSLVTGLHGTVGFVTHAGTNILIPSTAKIYWPLFFRQFKNSFGGLTEKGLANYERSLEQRQLNPNFIKAKRAGLGNDPNIVYDDKQFLSKYLGGISKMGNRGFETLKDLRQGLFDHYYNKLSNVDKADPEVLKAIANICNNATGLNKAFDFASEKANTASRTILFAKHLEASRWARWAQPVKAVYWLSLGKKATPEQKVGAKIILNRTAQLVGTLGSTLVVNATFQNAFYPNNPVNLTHPSKEDWLHYKIGENGDINFTGGMLSLMHVVGKLYGAIHMDQADLQRMYHTEDRNKAIGQIAGQYFRGKLSPIAGHLYSWGVKKDYSGDVLPPYSEEKPNKYHHRMTWTEYAVTQHAPIFVSKAFSEIYKGSGLPEDNTTDILNSIIIGAINGGTGIDYRVDKPKDNDPIPSTHDNNTTGWTEEDFYKAAPKE